MGCAKHFTFDTRQKCEAVILGTEGLFSSCNIFSPEMLNLSDPCSPSPCHHTGVCISLGVGGAHCECAGTGWYGITCRKSKYTRNTPDGAATNTLIRIESNYILTKSKASLDLTLPKLKLGNFVV